MNLLLLLSALLSALSGAGVAARPAGAAQEIASSVRAAATRTVRHDTARPQQALPTRRLALVAVPLPRLSLLPVALWASRRRE